MRDRLSAQGPARRLGLATLASAAVAVSVGCGSTQQEATTPKPSTTTAGAQTAPPQQSIDGVSPGGVTTSLSAPAESTEEEYFQACHAAKVWIDQQGGDPKAQIEPYLAMVQSAAAPGPGTFGTPWSELAPGRQAAVIVAVTAAADALCG